MIRILIYIGDLILLAVVAVIGGLFGRHVIDLILFIILMVALIGAWAVWYFKTLPFIKKPTS